MMNPSDQPQVPASRRDFLKTSTLAGVGAALVGPTGLCSSLYAGGDDTIKVGLVACGSRGTEAAVQALSTNGNVKLTSICDAFAENAESGIERIKNSLGSKIDRFQVTPDKVFIGLDAYQKV